MIHRAAALPILCLTACAALAPIPPREPAVHGLPLDVAEAPLSAVWVGHATVLLRFGHRYVLTDPNLRGSLMTMPRITPASVSVRELPRLDAVVISHMHFDHFDEATVRKLGPRPAVFFPDQGQPYADAIEQPRRQALRSWEQVRVGDVTITAVPARHSGGRWGIDALWNHAFTGYVIEGAGHRVFFAGDTGYDPVIFKEIAAAFLESTSPSSPSRPRATTTAATTAGVTAAPARRWTSSRTSARATWSPSITRRTSPTTPAWTSRAASSRWRSPGAACTTRSSRCTPASGSSFPRKR